MPKHQPRSLRQRPVTASDPQGQKPRMVRCDGTGVASIERNCLDYIEQATEPEKCGKEDALEVYGRLRDELQMRMEVLKEEIADAT